MEKVVKEFMVAVKKRGEFMGQGEDNMEVRGVDDLRLALIHLEFLLDGRAVCISNWKMSEAE